MSSIHVDMTAFAGNWRPPQGFNLDLSDLESDRTDVVLVSHETGCGRRN